MGFDFIDFDQPFANSAYSFDELNRKREETLRAIDQANQEKREREERMVAGAEANIAHNELLKQQVDIIQKQNEILSDNYAKLKELYDIQVEANKEAKEELKSSKRFNIAMMIIAFIAMLAAIAGPIVTVAVSK